MSVPRPPAVNGRQHPALFDTECFPNYWLLKFRPIGGVTVAHRLHAGQRFTPEQAREVLAQFDGYLAVSFNGRGYDQWMIGAACSGYTPAELKTLNDTIIVQRVKPWEIPDLPRWEPPNHVDLMEVAPGDGSLKFYAARIHSKTIRDLPYSPDEVLNAEQIAHVDDYCDTDLDDLADLYAECEPLLQLREALSQRYGIDLRSKSDAQVAEAVLKRRCEQATGRRIYRPEWTGGQVLRYRPPPYVAFATPELQHALQLIRDAQFYASATGNIDVPPSLERLVINLGRTSYKVGIGGLHSQEKCVTYRSDAGMQLRAPDVVSYYPSLIINSGEYPPAFGPVFRTEYAAIKAERVQSKGAWQRIAEARGKEGADYKAAKAIDEGNKTSVNGTFGKTNSPFSPLYAPSLMLQTTLTGQLSLLMLIEWHEHYGIPVVSANTDGLVIACPRHLLHVSDHLIAEWQRRTDLEMENADWSALYARDVNNYFAVTTSGEVKRKGEYNKAGLVEKKSPDLEVCSDAVAEYLARGVPLEATICACRDVRKFVTVQRVTGGGVKLWGDGPRKTDKVRDMVPRLEAHGWVKSGSRWAHWSQPEPMLAADAYATTFPPQRPEYLGKVVRWYYSTSAPGPIAYATRNAVVSLSYGAHPCMTLPNELPRDVDYGWYIDKARAILDDVGYRTVP